jgi:hypothetical protein
MATLIIGLRSQNDPKEIINHLMRALTLQTHHDHYKRFQSDGT